MQNLTIAGNCGKDAELRTTQGGDQVLNFSLAVDNGQRDGHQQSSDGYGSGYGAGGRPGSSDLDDEIPFAPSVL